jgi:hypothetical protein
MRGVKRDLFQDKYKPGVDLGFFMPSTPKNSPLFPLFFSRIGYFVPPIRWLPIGT